MFEAGSKYGKIVTLLGNGVGLLLMIAGSTEIVSFISPELIGYIVLAANIAKAATDKAAEAIKK